MMPKTAMIMAAGFGTRMRPLTEHLPKPLVQVAGKPLIDYALDFLVNSGVEKVVVNSHYLAEMLEEHLAKRTNAPQIIISRESEVLETGGGVLNALPLLGDEPFFVVNSDVICIDGSTPALQRLWSHWNDDTMDALLLLQEVKNVVGYEGAGDFFITNDGSLQRRGENKIAPLVFTGVQILHPRLFAGAKVGKFSTNVLYNKNLSRVGSVVHDGNWLHIGDIQGIKQAEDFLISKDKISHA